MFSFQENFAGNGRLKTNIQQFYIVYALKDRRNIVKMLEIIILKDNKKFFFFEFSSLCLVAHDNFIYLDVGPLSKYSPVTLHLSPITGILHENPAMLFCLFLPLYI